MSSCLRFKQKPKLQIIYIRIQIVREKAGPLKQYVVIFKVKCMNDVPPLPNV